MRCWLPLQPPISNPPFRIIMGEVLQVKLYLAVVGVEKEFCGSLLHHGVTYVRAVLSLFPLRLCCICEEKSGRRGCRIPVSSCSKPGSMHWPGTARLAKLSSRRSPAVQGQDSHLTGASVPCLSLLHDSLLHVSSISSSKVQSLCYGVTIYIFFF